MHIVFRKSKIKNATLFTQKTQKFNFGEISYILTPPPFVTCFSRCDISLYCDRKQRQEQIFFIFASKISAFVNVHIVLQQTCSLLT